MQCRTFKNALRIPNTALWNALKIPKMHLKYQKYALKIAFKHTENPNFKIVRFRQVQNSIKNYDLDFVVQYIWTLFIALEVVYRIKTMNMYKTTISNSLQAQDKLTYSGY